MYNLTERKITIGIFCGIFIILVFLLKSYYDYSGSALIENYNFKQIIILITYYFFYINLLILLYNIVVKKYKQNQLKSFMKWLIWLEVLSGILAILTNLEIHYGIFGVNLAIRLALIVIYFLIFSRLFRIEKKEIPDISEIHSFMIAFLIMLIALIGLSFLIEYGRKPELGFIKQLLIIFPFIFIIRFLIKVKRHEFRNETASV